MCVFVLSISGKKRYVNHYKGGLLQTYFLTNETLPLSYNLEKNICRKSLYCPEKIPYNVIKEEKEKRRGKKRSKKAMGE